jgi:hypothetical protein
LMSGIHCRHPAHFRAVKRRSLQRHARRGVK